MKRRALRLRAITAGSIFLAVLGFLFCPKPDLLEPYTFSRAVFDREGNLLNLSLSLDEKYRLFVPYKKINEHTKKALLTYEDKRFSAISAWISRALRGQQRQ